MQYKGARRPLRQIVGELGVDGVVEGGVLREGAQVPAHGAAHRRPHGQDPVARTFEREISGFSPSTAKWLRPSWTRSRSHCRRRSRPSWRARAGQPRSLRGVSERAHALVASRRPQDVDRALQYFQFATEKDRTSTGPPRDGLRLTYYASAGLMPSVEARSKVIASTAKRSSSTRTSPRRTRAPPTRTSTTTGTGRVRRRSTGAPSS